MAFFTVNKENHTQEFSGSGGKIIRNKSGMYPVTLKHVVVNVTPSGAEMISLVVDYEGQENTLPNVYCVTSGKGEPNAVGRDQLGKLAIVCGIDGDLEPVSRVVSMFNKKEEQSVLEEFEDCQCTLHVKRKYDLYNGKVTERISIINVFEADTNASAVELVNKELNKDGVVLGKQFNIESEYAEQDILCEGVTQEMVDEFISERKQKTKAPKDNKPKSGLSSSGRFGNKG